MRANSIFHQIVRSAWLEYAVTRQVSTGQGEPYIANWRIPGWFKAVELGLGQGEGPSIIWWSANMAAQHKRAYQALETSGEGAPVVLYPAEKRRSTARASRRTKMTAGKAHRKLRALAVRAGISVQDGMLVRVAA